MTDSSITITKGGTTFVGADAVHLYRARVLVSALRLYAKTGMKPNAAYKPTVMLQIAGQYTGKTYKRGQYLQAADDLATWADAMQSALPVDDRRGRP